MIFNPGFMAAAGGGGAVVGTYTGDGASYRRFTFDFEPAAMIIIRNAGSYSDKLVYRTTIISEATFATIESLAAFSKTSSSGLLDVITAETQAKAFRLSDISSADMPAINKSSVIYTYIAIHKA